MSRSNLKTVVTGIEEGGRMSCVDRRQQLIRVAIKVFSQKGFSGATTKEIASAAGVSEAIIFRHFPTKDDLYAAILDHKASESSVDVWLKELSEYAERRDDEGLFQVLAARIVEHHRKDVDFVRLMLYSALEGHELARQFREKQFLPIHDFLRDYIAARQKEGAFRDCNPRMAVRAFVGMPFYHSIMNWLFEFNVVEISDKKATEAFTNLILSGLRAEAASAAEE